MQNYVYIITFKGDMKMTKGMIEFQGEKCVFELDETNFLLEIEVITNRGVNEEYLRNFGSLKPRDNLFEGLLVGKTFDNKFIYFNIHNMERTNHDQFQGIVSSYMISSDEVLAYDSLVVQADELNYLYPPSQAYSFSENLDTVFVDEFDKNIETFSFDMNEEHIEAKLRIQSFSHIGTGSPLSSCTYLNLTFSEKKELSFAEDLTFLIKRFLMFVTFRRNVNCTKLTLMRRREPDKINRTSVGELFINMRDSFVIETDKKVRERVINYSLIKEHLNNLFTNLANEEVYMSHLPETIQESRLITPARYIMVTAGFEWEFSRSLEVELTHDTNTKYKKEIQDISAFFDKKIEDNSGKEKKFYKNTKRRALGDVGQKYTLQQKLEFAFEEFDDVLNIFITQIFYYNGVTFDSKYNDLSERIAERRNAIGHGNIAKEAHAWHGIDMLILEWLYYAMVLRSIGMDDHKIKVSINEVFRRGIAL